MSGAPSVAHAHDKTEERDALIRLLSSKGNEPERIAGQMGLPVETVREVVGVRELVGAESFRLGEGWPDWWADLVSQNVVTTHNVDGRLAGGPDCAVIRQNGVVMVAMRGSTIVRAANGDIYVG